MLRSRLHPDSALHHRAQGSSRNGEAMRLEVRGSRSNAIEASHDRTQNKDQKTQNVAARLKGLLEVFE